MLGQSKTSWKPLLYTNVWITGTSSGFVWNHKSETLASIFVFTHITVHNHAINSKTTIRCVTIFGKTLCMISDLADISAAVIVEFCLLLLFHAITKSFTKIITLNRMTYVLFARQSLNEMITNLLFACMHMQSRCTFKLIMTMHDTIRHL